MLSQPQVREEAAHQAANNEPKQELSEEQQEQLQKLDDEERKNDNRYVRNTRSADMSVFRARRQPAKPLPMSGQLLRMRIAIQGRAVGRMCRGRHKLKQPSAFLLLRPIIWLMPDERDRLAAGEFFFKRVQLQSGQPPEPVEFHPDMLSADAIGGTLALIEGRAFSQNAVRTLQFRTALTNYFQGMRDVAIEQRDEFEMPEAVVAKIDGILVFIRQRGKKRGWKFVDSVYNEFLLWSNRLK